MWAGPRKAVRPDPLEQLRMAFFLQPILSPQKMSDTSVDKELEDPQELLDSKRNDKTNRETYVS